MSEQEFQAKVLSELQALRTDVESIRIVTAIAHQGS